MYLPKNYDKNYIIIFYDQKDGVSKERIDGKRLFKIPNSGIFYTQYNMQREWVKYKYYYIDDDGTVLKQIKHRYDVEKLDSNEVYVMDGFASFKETDGYESQHEIIGKPNIIGENNTLLPLTKTRNIIDSIVKSKGCLKKKN